MKKMFIVPGLLLLFMFIYGCGSGGGSGVTGLGDDGGSQIVLNNGVSSLRLPTGSESTIEVVVKDAGGQVVNDPDIDWEVSNGIGYVNYYGVFRAYYPGVGTIEATVGESKSSLTVDVYQSLITEAYRNIKSGFLYQDRLSAELGGLSGSALESALLARHISVESFVASLGDPYTRYVAAGEDSLDYSLSGSYYAGIGAMLTQRNSQTIILYPFPDSPARLAGLKAGDIITRVDSLAISGLSLSEIIAQIRGTAGTAVQLTISRGGQTFAFGITRREIESKDAYGEMLSSRVGYIKLLQFGYSSAGDFISAYNAIGSSAEVLVIDLRGNGGGEVFNTAGITSCFVPEGKTIFWYRGYNDNLSEYEASSGLKIFRPVVLLVDEWSASASEIMAAALIDNGLAEAVGQKTYGKGVMQQRTYLSDSSILYITTAEFLSPARNVINGVGINPVEESAITDADLAAGRDPQLEAALARGTALLSAGVSAQASRRFNALSLPKVVLPPALKDLRDRPETPRSGQGS
ncbi:MAG: S41 family peptidase [bacterium]